MSTTSLWTVVKNGTVLAERQPDAGRGEFRWVGFEDIVGEAGDDRSFARFEDEGQAKIVASATGGRIAAVTTDDKCRFQIVLRASGR